MVGLLLFWNCFLYMTEKMYSVTTSLVACARPSQDQGIVFLIEPIAFLFSVHVTVSDLRYRWQTEVMLLSMLIQLQAIWNLSLACRIYDYNPLWLKGKNDYIFWRCLANFSSLSPWMLHITIYLWLKFIVDFCCYVVFINQQVSEFAHLFLYSVITSWTTVLCRVFQDDNMHLDTYYT